MNSNIIQIRIGESKVISRRRYSQYQLCMLSKHNTLITIMFRHSIILGQTFSDTASSKIERGLINSGHINNIHGLR